MVLCSRCHPSESMQPCLVGGRKPCLVCQEDMELERTIQELQEKRRILRRRMNAVHDPFVLAFPPEISSQIFLLSMEKWDDEPYDPENREVLLRKLPTPFLLGAVCRGWRQLARSTPQLWTTFSFTLAQPTKITLLQAVSDWLQLSGSLPLDIWIFYKFSVMTRPDSEEIRIPVIDTVSQHSGRWRKVVLRGIPPFYLNRLCSTSDPPSRLYDLEVTNRRRMLDTPDFSLNLKASPTHLTIKNGRLSADDIGWDNLTIFVMDGVAINECMEVIQRAPLLESCTLAGFSSATRSIPKTIFRHMHLRMLHVQPVVWVRLDYESFINLIDALECPSLEKFSVQEAINNMMVDSWISFFKRSGSHLKELKLHRIPNFQIGVEGFKKLYNAVPYLQHLDLHWSKDAVSTILDDLFQQLSSSVPILEGGTPVFLPHLESLRLRLHTLDFRSPAGAGRHIPRIYSWPHRKLLSLELRLWEIEIDDHASTKLSNLIDDGVNMRILTGKDGKDYFQNIHTQQPSLANPPT